MTYHNLILAVLTFLIKNKKLKLDLIFNRLNFFLLLIFLVYILKNFLNNGCLIYPLYFTCFGDFAWSQTIENVKYLNSWYELWAKGGAGPNFRVENPEIYLSNFNWVPRWLDIYFFNKVSDFLLGIISISIVCFFSFYSKLRFEKKRQIIFPLLFSLIIFLIWFLQHPSLRYGGFSIIALFFSLKYNFRKI